MHPVKKEILRLSSLLMKSQSPDGSWNFCFESGILTDAYMIVLLRSLELSDDKLILMLSERILKRQENNGAWKLHHDEKDGNLSATIEAYSALLWSGARKKQDPSMVAARNFIISKGGIEQATLLTKFMLALTGQYSWPKVFVPVEIVLLPPSFPICFFDFVGYARVHMAPMLITADQKFVRQTRATPDLSELVVPTDSRMGFHPSDSQLHFYSFVNSIKEAIKNLPYLPDQIHQKALQRCEQYILERLEPDGTLYSYFSATFLMVFALLARNYSAQHPVITKAVKALKRLACSANGFTHIQNSTCTVWDTALLSHSLQEAGMPPNNPTIKRSGQYLLSRQQKKYGDWRIHNPLAPPGGWGFSDINTINPDVDDTTAALRALKAFITKSSSIEQNWKSGLNWVLSMQNADGGWPAFEKNTDKAILTMLPIDGAKSVSTDPSSADLTGRTLEFLGDCAGFTLRHPAVQRAIEWLLRNQENNGSWYGRWGICYTYGTWAALTGMMAVGMPTEHPAIRRSVDWILSIQNEDGGWGESCKSDQIKQYVPLRASTPSQTAWMIDALVASSSRSTPAIEKGVYYLLKSGTLNDWTVRYPTGAGLPGGFYTHYHSYRYIWPLLALSHYWKKLLGGI